MKTKVYKVRNDIEHINKLGELGWEVISKYSPAIIAKSFRIDEKAPILNQFVELFEYNANKDTKIRIKLNSKGYCFRKVYMDDIGYKIYKLTKTKNCPIFQWRVEFATTLTEGEEDPILGLTFGDLETNIPAFLSKDVIDKYTPAEIIKGALEADAIYEVEVDDEDPSVQNEQPGGKE